MTAKRNLLEQASQIPNVDDAARLIQDALGIVDGGQCAASICLEDWRHMLPGQRLMALAEWLYDECYLAIDQDHQIAAVR